MSVNKKIDAISPLDGRYYKDLSELSAFFSEEALFKYRLKVEIEYFKLLLKEISNFDLDQNQNQSNFLKSIIDNYNDRTYQEIKSIEAQTNHDVKAVEIFLRNKLLEVFPKNLLNLIHFGLTSEDVNNISYNLLIKDYITKIHLPSLKSLLHSLLILSSKYKNSPWPARTHGQMATPTTAGKELAVYLNRLFIVYKKINSFEFYSKLNGATGNFSAMVFAAKEIDWYSLADKFINSFGLKTNIITTQIEDNDNLAELFFLLKRQNNILIDFNRDMWMYISYGYLKNLADPNNTKEIGSSTMPHKINPINFENSEGNSLLSNNLLNLLADELTRSRMQRDLVGSTLFRNVGVAMAHSYLALKNVLKGLKRIDVDENVTKAVLESNPSLLSEPIQTKLKMLQIMNSSANDEDDPYELTKQYFRGKSNDRESYAKFVNSLNISEKQKKIFIELEVKEYIGIAPKLAERVIEEVNNYFKF
ncbi:MAG: adenylosuccinate lyase [Oligoflexia bacterium]|nr:adenylosuccinate lyase [Oligoflexia bacterium]